MIVTCRFLLVSIVTTLLIINEVFAGGENYQYANVPAHGVYEFGYKRGNPKHYQERHETRHGPKFKTKVRWGDHYGGYGEQLYDYNHADKSYDKGGHGGGGGGHGGHGGGGYGHGR